MKMTIYIAVIPHDYARADVELFETRGEARAYVDENAIRDDTHYCSILEREILFKPTTVAAERQ